MSEYLIFEAQGDDVSNEAILICSQDWRDRIKIEGPSLLTWHPEIQNEYTLFCLSGERSKQISFLHGGLFKYRAVCGVYESAQGKGYSGPADLQMLAQWAGCALEGLASPLGRCRIMAAIMRSNCLK